MTFLDKLNNPNRPIFLYGTTPPRADSGEDRVARSLTRLVKRADEMAPDALVAYDVQDERARTSEIRPFPYLPTLESRDYSRRLALSTDRQVITYKCIAGMSVEAWDGWLDDANADYGIRFLSVVGRASSKIDTVGITLSSAIASAKNHPAGFTCGGVAIPERHSPAQSESQRLISKARFGCEYFISQAVYDPAKAIRLLRDYSRDCSEKEIEPKRIVLTFTPCGRKETMVFMDWLGISIPVETREAILSVNDPNAKSISLCGGNLRKILDACWELEIPLGVNVESISIAKAEIEASVDLFHSLRELIGQYRSL